MLALRKASALAIGLSAIGPSVIASAIGLSAIACTANAAAVAVDAKNDQCSTCRMVVSDPKNASEIVAPYQEPKFFDDLGCLNSYLAENTLPKDARVFVADHRTGEFVTADRAVFTRLAGRSGAMGSPFVAHGSAASRDADRDAASGSAATLADALPAFAQGVRR